MKFYGGVRGVKRNKWLDFGSDLDHHADFPIGQRLLNKLWAGFHEIFRIALQWYKEQFLSDLDYLADSSNGEPRQYRSNELP